MKIRSLLLILPLAGLLPAKSFAQGNTERGAVIGGLGGALAGAAIGKHNGETGAGALLGGAVGLLAGSAIGNSQDRDVQRQQAYYQQRHYQYQVQSQYQAQAAARAVSTQDVVAMTQSGLDPQVIVTQIHQNGVTRKLEVSDVISLHQQGVSEAVITAMQNARVASAIVPTPVYSPAPVVVEHYHAPPYYRSYYQPRVYYHYHSHGHGHGH